MALIVGNLLTEPAATSFISLADAEAYLTQEAAGQADTTPVGRWFVASSSTKEAMLVRASRWLAVSLPWAAVPLTDADLARVGAVAARLAVDALEGDLWASEAIGKQAKRYKAGSVEIEYADTGRVSGANAGGKRFPWVYPMLRGLLSDASQRKVVRA